MYQTVRHGVIPALSAEHLSDNIEFVWQSVPQPWHPQSGLMHDALMAVHRSDDGLGFEFVVKHILNR